MKGEADPNLKTLLEPHLESSAASRNPNGVFHFKAVKWQKTKNHLFSIVMRFTR